MSILLSGDFHANATGEIDFITREELLKKFKDKYNEIDTHIILGDAGFLWIGNRIRDLHNYKILSKRHFPILCVQGNHEPFYGMSDLPEVDIGIGETVYQINDEPFIAYLKRGKVYIIDRIKFLVLGGALSIDIAQRIPVLSWWKQEYWSEEEKKDVFKLLKKDNCFDCVLSHTGPNQINKTVFPWGGDPHRPTPFHEKFDDEVAILNDRILKKIQFQEWWCGHWHKDRYYLDEKSAFGYQYLYTETKIMEKTGNKIIIHNEHGMTKR